MTDPTVPSLDAYAQRVGAKQKNFRRFVIEEHARELYHFDRYVITIDKDGGVNLREARGGEVPEDKMPTEDERSKIKAEWITLKMPSSIAARDTRALRDKLPMAPILFEYPGTDSKGNNGIVFVQQRIFQDDGGKTDLPWTFWSDGEWRRMEPDGLLPLYGLDKLTNAARVYIHEGAKTAAYVQRLVDLLDKPASMLTTEEEEELETCPWIFDLRHTAHLGWPGGAPNPHRVDWRSIAMLSPHVRVTLVCDHDAPGENAASYISRMLKRRLSIVRFGADFPRSFDMSDPFPQALYEEKKGRMVYVGPSMIDCTEPATWATTSKFELRPEFIEEWYSIIRPGSFINKLNLRKRYDEAEFNSIVSPYSDVPNVAAMLRKVISTKAAAVAYEPSRPAGRIALDGEQVINCYLPPSIKPREGDRSKLEDFFEYLIPDEGDRNHTMRWCATLIARPDLRMTYSLLLISQRQGVGKSTLGEKIIAPLVGLQNCSFPTPHTVIDTPYTTWIAFKRLAVIAEIYDGHSAKAYNKLKTYITDTYVRLEEKYEKGFDIRNYIHVIASSNSFRALKIDDNDRRWFIPGVTEELMPFEYWQRFNAWLKEEHTLATIAWWAKDYVERNGAVAVGEHAPTSNAKKRAIEHGHSEGEQIIGELALDMIELGKAGTKIVVRQDELRRWLASRKAALDSSQYGYDGNRKLETAERISSIMRAAGLSLPDERFRAGGDRFRVVANFDVGPEAEVWDAEGKPTWDAISGFYLNPETVKEKAGEPF
jgi:hypothetical protein